MLEIWKTICVQASEEATVFGSALRSSVASCLLAAMFSLSSLSIVSDDVYAPPEVSDMFAVL